MTESDEKRLKKNDLANMTIGRLELTILHMRQIQSVNRDDMADYTLEWMEKVCEKANELFNLEPPYRYHR